MRVLTNSKSGEFQILDLILLGENTFPKIQEKGNFCYDVLTPIWLSLKSKGYIVMSGDKIIITLKGLELAYTEEFKEWRKENNIK